MSSISGPGHNPYNANNEGPLKSSESDSSSDSGRVKRDFPGKGVVTSLARKVTAFFQGIGGKIIQLKNSIQAAIQSDGGIKAAVNKKIVLTKGQIQEKGLQMQGALYKAKVRMQAAAHKAFGSQKHGSASSNSSSPSPSPSSTPPLAKKTPPPRPPLPSAASLGMAPKAAPPARPPSSPVLAGGGAKQASPLGGNNPKAAPGKGGAPQISLVNELKAAVQESERRRGQRNQG